MMPKNDPKLKSELCFLCYVSSKEVIKKYTTHLRPFDLTYTGYITLTSIGDEEVLNIKELGDRIFLNSGTLTPLIKKLVSKGLVQKLRNPDDERNLNLSLTDEGRRVKAEIKQLSRQVSEELIFEDNDMEDLVNILNRFVKNNFDKTV